MKSPGAFFVAAALAALLIPAAAQQTRVVITRSAVFSTPMASWQGVIGASLADPSSLNYHAPLAGFGQKYLQNPAHATAALAPVAEALAQAGATPQSFAAFTPTEKGKALTVAYGVAKRQVLAEALSAAAEANAIADRPGSADAAALKDLAVRLGVLRGRLAIYLGKETIADSTRYYEDVLKRLGAAEGARVRAVIDTETRSWGPKADGAVAAGVSRKAAQTRLAPSDSKRAGKQP
jgi:hypothetical protein